MARRKKSCVLKRVTIIIVVDVDITLSLPVYAELYPTIWQTCCSPRAILYIRKYETTTIRKDKCIYLYLNAELEKKEKCPENELNGVIVLLLLFFRFSCCYTQCFAVVMLDNTNRNINVR